MTYKPPRETLDFSLLANFVHQVINPLNGVCGTLDNLADGTTPEYKREMKTRQARAQLEHSIMLVRNLAYFSQISLDPQNTNSGAIKKTCVIPQVIIEAILFFQDAGATKNIKIELEDKITQYRAQGNPDLLRQVFMNLFDNAVKYGDKDSIVNVTTWVQKNTDTLIVKVSGKSAPVPPDERDRVFELGYRSGNAKAKVASGTGLGLHICRVIMEEVHDGEIYLESSITNRTNAFLLKFPKFDIGPNR